MSPCLKKTFELLEKYVESGAPIAPDLVEAVFCNGIKTAPENIFFKLFEKYSLSSKQSLKITILNSLGCTRNATLLKNHLKFAIDDPMAKNQILQIIVFIDHGKSTLNELMDFVRENHFKLASLEVLLPVCTEIASRVFDQDLLDSFISLLDYLESKGLISKIDLESFTKSANFIDWQSANLAIVQNFLKDQKLESTTSSAAPITTESSSSTSEQTSNARLVAQITPLLPIVLSILFKTLVV